MVMYFLLLLLFVFCRKKVRIFIFHVIGDFIFRFLIFLIKIQACFLTFDEITYLKKYLVLILPVVSIQGYKRRGNSAICICESLDERSLAGGKQGGRAWIKGKAL